MRGLLVVYASLVGCEAGWQAPGAGEEGPDASFARASDTGALRLEATLETCPVGFDDIGLPHPEGAKTCVHPTATVLGTYDAGVVIGDGAVIDTRAHLGADSTLGAMAYLAAGAQVGSGSELGTAAVIGRNAQVGSGTVIGPDSVIGRSASVGSDVAALLGDLTLGYGASLGDRCVIDGSFVTLGNLVTLGSDCRIGAGTVVARSTTLGERANLAQGVVIGPNTTAGPDLTLATQVRVRKQAVFGSGVTVDEQSAIGRGSTLDDDASIGANSRLGAHVRVGARGIVQDDTWILRGTVIDGNPLDIVPPTISGGQSFGISLAADSGATVGQVVATDNNDDIVHYAIVSGDPGGATPYFEISNTGLLVLTTVGASDFDTGATLGIEATDGAGNTGSETVDVTIDYTFTCSGGGDWIAYANLVDGTRVNLCVLYNTPNTPGPDRTINVFTNPNVVTSCLATSEFAEDFFRNTSGDPHFGAVRYETMYSPRLASGADTTSPFVPERFHCANGLCSAAAFDIAHSGNDQRVYVAGVDVCTISIDGYQLPLAGISSSWRLAYIQYGSSARALVNQDMGGTQSKTLTFNATQYQANRLLNGSAGQSYTAFTGYSFLEMD
jgi:UDP-3-O-[3-hydroxymyristoyl] glucosamine N-acyltransferase